jgi:hypothetical protein
MASRSRRSRRSRHKPVIHSREITWLRVIAGTALALVHSAVATSEDREGAGTRSVYSPALPGRAGGECAHAAQAAQTASPGSPRGGCPHRDHRRTSRAVPRSIGGPCTRDSTGQTARRTARRPPVAADPDTVPYTGGFIGGCVMSRKEAASRRIANGRSWIHRGDDDRWRGYVSMGQTTAAKPVRRHVRGRLVLFAI